MTLIEIVLFCLAMLALIFNRFTSLELERLERRVHIIQIECEEIIKTHKKLYKSIKRVKRKLD